MKLSSALLGAVAGIAAIGAAQAADLPMTKGEAVEYVKVCSTFGPGFFYIPGSDTCLKIGGEIRADYRVFGGKGFDRDDDRSAFNTQGRIWFDARTETDWGLLRSYFQINADSHKISNQGRGAIYNSNTFTVDKAFIQFGGLTAGYAHSFFGFYDNDYGNTIWAPYYAEGNTVNLIAYTAEFGSGFKATLSIEDGRDHRVDSGFGIIGITSSGLQGGQQIPDIVGKLRLDQDWGSLAVQAALHQSRTAEALRIVDPNNPNNVVTAPIRHDDKWGYAVGATGLIKLPFIDGGHFIVEGQYADGATDYLGAGSTVFGTAPGDIYIQGVNGTTITALDRAKGWSIVAELGGNITPALSANLVGSYIDTKAENFLGAGVDTKLREYTIAGNLTYTIVKGLSVGAEVAYTHSKLSNGVGFSTRGPVLVDGDADAWQGGIRLKRTF